MSLIESQTAAANPTTKLLPVSYEPAAFNSPRLLSLDAYRGMAMLLMISEGFGLAAAAAHFPGSAGWQFLARQTTHVRWQGCHFWDLIMPAFIFIVGVALPFSFAARQAKGQSRLARWAHVLGRSLLLVLLGILVVSHWADRREISFFNVLCQIGLAYPFACLLVGRRFRTQLAASLLVLGAYGLWFYLHPLPGPDFDRILAGVPEHWAPLSGVAAHWDLNTNAGAAFDCWFLNLFPRSDPFQFRAGGGTTLNFVPAIATMLFGVMVGQLLQKPLADIAKIRRMLLAGLIALLAGVALDPAILPGIDSMQWTLCPIIKTLWTPSWVLYSGGWVILSYAVLYWIVECRQLKSWTFPFLVVGMNSLLMYLLAAMSRGWIVRTLRIHAGPRPFEGPLGSILESVCVLAILWLFGWWLYRRRLFIRI